MRLRLTEYGLPQVVVYPLILTALIIAWLIAGIFLMPIWLIITGECILLIVTGWALSFFRDPERTPPGDTSLLISPADGTVADITTVTDDPDFQGSAVKIGIFLSVFNVHINRAPCEAKVIEAKYRKGQFKDARHPLAGKVNESNTLKLAPVKNPNQIILVRQISGAIARRIVCRTVPNQQLAAGEQFGMIKFGSRTELVFSSNLPIEILVKKGDKVKAGLTVLAKYT